MKNQNLFLKVGDKIGFTFMASEVDADDKTLFFPVCQITTRDNERAYLVEFPDGTVSKSAIRQSDLANRAVQIAPVGTPDMVCISDRKDEFVSALERGKKSNLEVFPYWERDTFVVKNHDNKKEYHVNFQNADSKIFAECTCPDYEFKKRLCKHIGAVLVTSIFSSN